MLVTIGNMISVSFRNFCHRQGLRECCISILPKGYRVELVIKPSITSHFQGPEAVFCLISFLALLKCLEKLLGYGDGVCRIQGNKGDWNTRMKHLQD